MKRMTNQELLEYNKKRTVCQICIATTRDMEEILDEWIDKLKVGPWTVITMSDKNVKNPTYGGKKVTEPFEYTVAVAVYGNIQIEIMKPGYGVNPANDIIKRTNGFGGLQHFKEKYDNEVIEQKVAELEALGFNQTFSGGLAEDVFYNFDTESSVGFSLELGNYADTNLPEEWYYIYPRE